MSKTNTPSTQDFIDIKNIDQDVVILKDGSLRQVIMVSGINLDLQSEEEKNTILGLYLRFLNSLDFTIQILIHSRKFNIDNYIKNISEREKIEPNELLKNQIFEYKQFIKTFVEQNDIMTKMFLIVVPFKSFGSSSKKGFFSFFSKKKQNPTEQNDEKSKQISYHQLHQRTDQVINGIQSIGLRAVVLNNEELTELFYNFYNPETVEKENINLPKNEAETNK